MGSVSFDISSATGSGADVQDTSTLVLGAGEIARVRFTKFTETASTELGVTLNGVTSYIPISQANKGGILDEQDDRAFWVAPALPGDTVFVRIKLNGSSVSNVAGILETIA